MQIQRAVTLTTGIQPSSRNIALVYQTLLDLLSYLSNTVRYYFELEVYDEHLMKTKIHYHGTISYNHTNVVTVNKFIKKCKSRLGHVKIKKITDKVIWDIYCKKQYKQFKSEYKTIPKMINNLNRLNITDYINKTLRLSTKIITWDDYLVKEAKDEESMAGCSEKQEKQKRPRSSCISCSENTP